MSEPPQPSIDNIPLDQIDVSDPHLFGNDNWQSWFARLRSESPVHYCANSPFGAYWSVTTHDLIKQVDSNHHVFSSAQGMTILDVDESSMGDADLATQNFIAMDPPKHDEHRGTVAPTLAPTNLANFEPLIRERAAEILENLPVGETINWVEEVSIELTAQMLATLFDFPYEHRRKLIHWSDVEDTNLGGKTIKEGDKVVMWYLSGNRDESVFEEADKLIIDRPNARAHLSFGFGIHRCMGNRLAEMQLRILWEEIMKHFDRVELVGDIVRLPNNFIRGFAYVPVRLIPKRRPSAPKGSC